MNIPGYFSIFYLGLTVLVMVLIYERIKDLNPDNQDNHDEED